MAGHIKRARERVAGGSIRPPRVLVVEDDGHIREAAVGALSKQGMIVRKSAKPDHLSRIISRFKPDVVVLDDYFRQARLGYAALMPKLIARHPSVRFVITSGRPVSELTSSTDPLMWGASNVVYKGTMLRDNVLEKTVADAAIR